MTVSCDEFATLLYGSADLAPEDTARCLAIIDADHKDTIPVFDRCLSSGTSAAREVTADFLREVFAEIKGSVEHGPEIDSEWEHVTLYDAKLWYPHSAAQALQIWNTVNVLQESGSSHDMEDTFTEINNMSIVYYEMDPKTAGYPLTDEYWRGRAAVALTGIYPDGRERRDLTPFISWAGEHKDIARVIDTAKERNTINIEVLAGVLEQQRSISSPLTQGTL